jgi:hypothetical protein
MIVHTHTQTHTHIYGEREYDCNSVSVCGTMGKQEKKKNDSELKYITPMHEDSITQCTVSC